MTRRMTLTSYRLLLMTAALFLLAATGGWWFMQSTLTASAAPGIQDERLVERVATERDIKVFKTATCGCCTAWVEHLEAAGFDVEAVDVSHDELNDLKAAAGLRRDLASCHTAFIDGYVVEGHVPAADIRRMIEERPGITGITVPGMPVGSPGMEVGDRFDPYDVIAFDSEGGTDVFAHHDRPGEGR